MYTLNQFKITLKKHACQILLILHSSISSPLPVKLVLPHVSFHWWEATSLCTGTETNIKPQGGSGNIAHKKLHK